MPAHDRRCSRLSARGFAPLTKKDPEDWVSGDEPMTGAQASYLTTLSEEAGEAAPSDDLTKAEASKRIDALRAQLGRA